MRSGWKQAGVSWKVYQQEDNYGCNVLENFTTFRNAAQSSPLYTKGLARGPEGQFEYDAINDKLPAVSWIIPTGISPSIRITCRRLARRSSPASSTPSRPIRTCGRRRRSF